MPDPVGYSGLAIARSRAASAVSAAFRAGASLPGILLRGFQRSGFRLQLLMGLVVFVEVILAPLQILRQAVTDALDVALVFLGIKGCGPPQ